MIWPIVTDSYIPKEWLNYIFDDSINMDEYTSPTATWFDKAEFFLWQRKWVAIKENWNLYNVWKTEWNIVHGVRYGKKIWSYTDKWYVYSFDWYTATCFLWIPTLVTQNTWANDLALNWTIIWVKQEFTTTVNETVLSSIKISMKANVALTGGEISVSLLNSLGVLITTADNILSTSALTLWYVDYSFIFSWVALTPSTKYILKVIVTWVDASKIVYIERSTTDVYISNDCYTIAPNNTETIRTYDIKFTVTGTRPFTYNPVIKRDILPISYIGWWIFWVTATVSAYNSWTRTVTIWSSILNSTYVAKFAYISAWATAGIRQVRQIESVGSATTFVVATWFTPDPVVWDTITFYTKKISQLWFPQLREWPSSPQSDKLVSIDREWFINYLYFPNFKRLILWDNRIAALSQNEDWIVYSDNESLERFTLISTTFWNDTAVNYAIYQSYLLVFFEWTIWLIRRVDFTSPIDWSITIIYKFNPSAAKVWLYSERSFEYVVTDFLMYWSNKIPYSVGISSTTVDDVKIELVSFGREIRNYTNKFNWGEVYFFNYNSNIILCHKIDWKTYNFVYKEDNKNWYPHIYNIEWTFMNFLFDVWWVSYSCYNNTFVSFSWEKDLWEDISQYLEISWPKTAPWDLATLLMFKIRVGVKSWQILWFKMRLTVWWPTETTTVYSSDNVPYIQKYNTTNLQETSLWSNNMWEEIIGTEATPIVSNKIDYFYVYFAPKMLLNTMLLEIKNKDWYPLFIGWVSPVYSSVWTPTIPDNLIIKQDNDIIF